MYKIIGANQAEYGPVSADQLRQWIVEGRVNGQTLAQAEGGAVWQPLSQFPEFANSFPAAGTTPPASNAGGTPLPVDSNFAASQVAGPAIGLIAVGALVIVLAVIVLIAALVGGDAKPPSTGNPQLDQILASSRSNTTANLIQAIFMSAVGGFILFGGIKMKRLESYGISLTASILAMIPCFTCYCCFLGLPIGIWALVVLNKPEVKAAFKR